MAPKTFWDNAKVWVFLLVFAAPGVIGYICLRSTVEYFGPNDRNCTGTGRNRNCSTAEGSQQIGALFGADVRDGQVSSDALLWIARACFAVYGVLVLVWLGQVVAGRIRRLGRRRQRRRATDGRRRS